MAEDRSNQHGRPEGAVRIEHVAIWTQNLERLTSFYRTYFGAGISPWYVNPARQFQSTFLTFASGARLELMQMSSVREWSGGAGHPIAGYAHLAFSVGSQEQVDRLTARLQQDGYRVLDGPRWTGDGYYESKVLDCEGNRIEITI